MVFRNLLLIVACFASVGAGWCLTRQDEVPIDRSRVFMQAKLEHARGIVEGLALENHERLAVSAQNLILLSQESAWNVIQSPEYTGLSSEFRGSAGRLKEAALARNIDAATIAWFEVTLNCVRCHKFLRQKIQK